MRTNALGFYRLMLAGLATSLLATPAVADLRHLHVTVRTGGDDLRGDNDNAFVRVTFSTGDRLETQLNRNNKRLPDHTSTTAHINAPVRGLDVSDVESVEILVHGFGGGIGGDNWNVDGINIRATSYDDDGGRFGQQTVWNENGSPLVRFTGNRHRFIRHLH